MCCMGLKLVVGIVVFIIFKVDIVGNCVCFLFRVRVGLIGKFKELLFGWECFEE